MTTEKVKQILAWVSTIDINELDVLSQITIATAIVEFAVKVESIYDKEINKEDVCYDDIDSFLNGIWKGDKND